MAARTSQAVALGAVLDRLERSVEAWHALQETTTGAARRAGVCLHVSAGDGSTAEEEALHVALALAVRRWKHADEDGERGALVLLLRRAPGEGEAGEAGELVRQLEHMRGVRVCSAVDNAGDAARIRVRFVQDECAVAGVLEAGEEDCVGTAFECCVVLPSASSSTYDTSASSSSRGSPAEETTLTERFFDGSAVHLRVRGESTPLLRCILSLALRHGFGPDERSLVPAIIPAQPSANNKHKTPKKQPAADAVGHTTDDDAAPAGRPGLRANADGSGVRGLSQPSSSSSMEYLLCLMRLFDGDADAFLHMLPVWRSKQFYLRHASDCRRRDVAEVIVQVAPQILSVDNGRRSAAAAQFVGFLNRAGMSDLGRLVLGTWLALETHPATATASTAAAPAITTGNDAPDGGGADELPERDVYAEGWATIERALRRDLGPDLLLQRDAPTMSLLAEMLLQAASPVAQWQTTMATELLTAALALDPSNEHAQKLQARVHLDGTAEGGDVEGAGAQEPEAERELADGEGVGDEAKEKDEGEDDKPASSRVVDIWERLTYLSNKKRLTQEDGYTLYDQDAVLSRSKVWQIQRNYYDVMGLEAWGGGDERKTDIVPSYITSNCFIAYSFAHTYFGLLVDLATREVLDKSEPVYCVELGTGHGKFSVLFLRKLRQLFQECRGEPALQGLRFTLVLTDFTESNVAEWASNVEVAEFFQSDDDQTAGVVTADCAIFDCEQSTELRLRQTGRVLSARTPAANPILTISNYVFDSLRTDVFKVGPQGSLRIGRLSVFIPGDESESWATNNLPKFKFLWCYKTVPQQKDRAFGVYPAGSFDARTCFQGLNNPTRSEEEAQPPPPPSGEASDASSDANAEAEARTQAVCTQVAEHVNRTLLEYCTSLPEGSVFTIPLGGFVALTTLACMSRSPHLGLLIADKGYNSLDLFKSTGDPIISLHGSLSIMVNLHSVGRVLQNMSLPGGPEEHAGAARTESPGVAAITANRSAPLDVCLMCTSSVTQPLVAPLAKHFFFEHMQRFSISDHYVLRDHVEDVCLTRLRAQIRASAGTESDGHDGRGDGKGDGVHDHQPKTVSDQNRQLTDGGDERSRQYPADLLHLPLDVIVCLVKLSGWDPDVVWQFGPILQHRLTQATQLVAEGRLTTAEKRAIGRLRDQVSVLRLGYLQYTDPVAETATILQDMVDALAALEDVAELNCY